MSANRNNPTPDRLPPHTIEAEQGLMGCLLMEPERTMDACKERGVVASWFYETRHATLFRVIAEMLEAKVHVDLVTLQSTLEQQRLLEDIGGFAELSALMDKSPSASAAPHYLELLEKPWLLRGAIRVGTALVQDCYEAEADPEHLLNRTQTDVSLLVERKTGAGEKAMAEALRPVLDRLEHYRRGDQALRGTISTGLRYADKVLAGLGGGNGNLIILAARPGVGKTAWAMQVAEHAALDQEWWCPLKNLDGTPVLNELGEPTAHKVRGQLPVGVFSLEMAADALAERMVFSRARADMQKFRTGFFDQHRDLPEVMQAMDALAGAKIFIEDRGDMTVQSIKAAARRMHRTLGIKLFIIDYIQLLKYEGTRYRSDRVQELAEISRELRMLAKELNVPFLVLAQMNRDFEKERLRVPRLSDLKDCGAIEQDADVVMFLHKPETPDEAALAKIAEMEEEAKRDPAKRVTWVSPYEVRVQLAKNRFGPGDKQIGLLFWPHCTRFEDLGEWKQKNNVAAWNKGQRPKKGEIDPDDIP